ncbi:MAG: LexA family transcriptional regulator [Lachnospiraceae bacterium]|nr:LexA family transcriptional regulator [Lachnospiraceae bacterium]
MEQTFGDKLKQARTCKGLKQSELAKQLGVTNTTISNWEKNVSKPDLDMLSYVCGVLNVKPNYFLSPALPDDEISIPEFKLIEKYRTLDPTGKSHVDTVLDWEAARSADIRQKDAQITALENSPATRLWAYYGKIACAGAGFIFDDIPTALIEAPPADADFIIGVSGDSMEPDYHDGEKLYVKKAERIRHGEIGIFTIRNECFLKEYGEAGLISKNPRYTDIPGDEDVRLVGKVVGKVEE